MAPADVTPLFTAAERDAFYSMVNLGVAKSVAGVSLLYLVTQISERPTSETTMREKWVPRGIRAYVEDNYVNSAEEREAWRLRGIGTYDAAFSRHNNRRLFQPAANLAYFCTVSGGSFKLKNPDRTPFTNPYSYRPNDAYSNGFDYYFKDPYKLAEPLFPVIDAQKHGAWGYFTCTMPDGKQAWWARIMPSTVAKPVFGSAFTMPISVIVHETPLEATPKVTYQVVSADQDSVIEQAFRTSKSVRKEMDGLTFEAWPADRFADRWGCRAIQSTATFGDRIIGNRRKVVCPSS